MAKPSKRPPSRPKRRAVTKPKCRQANGVGKNPAIAAAAPVTVLDASTLDGLQPHPLSDLFPMLDGDEFNLVLADIAEHHRVLVPVTLCEGMILDGRVRIAIARQLGIPCPIIHFEETDHSNPLAYLVSVNRLRSHYTIGQRIMIAAKIANMAQGQRTDLHQPSATWPKVSQEAAAKSMGVGVRSVRRGRYILDNGSPAEIEAAVTGKEDPAPLYTRIRNRIKGGPEPQEEDHVDKAGAKLVEALTVIGTFQHFHIDVNEIVERLARRNRSTLEQIHKLVDQHDPEHLFADLRVAVTAALAALEQDIDTDADDADDDLRTMRAEGGA